jgi:hypothetical protein
LRLKIWLLLAVALLLALPILATHINGAGQPPISHFVYSPNVPSPEEIITFDASGSYDPDGRIATYTWDFGDGNTLTATTPLVTHSYPIDGNYTVQLIVTDNDGLAGFSSTIVQVQTVVFFRVMSLTGLPVQQEVEVTVYYKQGSSWVKAPTGPHGLEIKYDRLTQPDLADTDAERYRNPGYTASILRCNASNIGFDLHPSTWTVFFKFQWGQYVSYWPNDTSRVYSYKDGVTETRDYAPGHRAYWDPTAGTYVISVKNIPKDGVAPTQSHPIIVAIRCPPSLPQYYLTVKTSPLDITTIPGEGWYYNGTCAALTAPQYVDASAGTRYRFDHWDVDGNLQGTGVNPINVTMNANHTATAHYVAQHSVTFDKNGLDSTATGTVATVNGNAKTFSELPYTVWVDSGGSVTYSYASPVSSTVSGKRFRLSSTSGPSSPIIVTRATTVTGNYVVQYLVTFAQTGLDSTATGTVVTVNGSAKTYVNMPFEWWVDSGSTITYTYSSTVSSSVQGKKFRLTGVHCPPPQFVVTEPTIITGSYCTQYLVTFAQTGLDSTATGTVVTVNGSAKTYSGLPYTFWVDSGSSVTYSYSSTVPSSSPDKQFRLNSVTGSTSPFTVTGPTTVTGNYVTQYVVTFTQTGLDSTATGTVVTINGNPKAYGSLPYTLWVDSGSSVTYSYESIVSSSVNGRQYKLTSVSGSSSPITVSGAVTLTGNYVTQYSVTFTHAGLDSTASGTVVTVNGNPKAYGSLPYTLWVDSGSSVTYSFNSIVPSSVSGKQFRLATVSGPSSPIIVTGATTVTGNYVVQYLVTFAQTGLDSTAAGTIVTVDGNLKTFTDLPLDTWIDYGSSITYSYNSIVLSSVSGKRFTQTSVSGPVSPITVTSSVTVTGNYKIQYQVTFDQLGVGSDFTGTIVTIDGGNYHYSELPTTPSWWDKDSNHTFSFASPLIVNASLSYAWSSTSGLTSLQAGTLTITASGSVVGNYIVQNCVTFDQIGASSDFTGTVLVVDGTPYNVTDLPRSFTWQIGSIHTFAFQSPLVVAPNAKQYIWTSTTGLSTLQSGSLTVSTYGAVIGHYKTQYYVDLATNPQGLGSPSGTGWYDDGTYASVSTAQYIYGGSRWRFAGWTTADMSEITDPASPSTTVLIDKAKTVAANYIHQHEVTFAQTGLDSTSSGTVVTVNGTSKAYTDLPYAIWVDEGSTLIYSYETTVTSITSGKQFRLASVSGSSSPITVLTDTTVTGNYVTQYCLTVSSPYGTTGGQGWYDSGVNAYATLNTNMIDHGNGTYHVFTTWNGDASGTNYAQSNPIVMNGPKGALANWKTQYSVTFTHSGLDSSASGTVATVNGVPVTFSGLPYNILIDNGGTVESSYNNVSSTTPGKTFVLTGVSGPVSPMTVSGPVTITGNYKTRYQVTFDQSGVGSDFTGTVVTIDGAPYTRSTMPAVFWWDSGSSHTFSFISPLIVNISTQYNWASTTGLSTLQSDTLTITGSGSVTGNYATEGKHQVAFTQTGVGEFLGTVVIIDGSNYKVMDLPVTFWWNDGSIHTFAFQSPLIVSPSLKQYVWTNTSGPWPWQSGSINVTASAIVVGNYKTMFYLTMATNPTGVTSPTGAGWYDSGVLATISTQTYIDIVPGSSRYRFNGWTTPDMIEIADPLSSPTTVLMDKGKTVTALYATQHNVTFKQAGVSSDFTGTIVTIDGRDYNFSGLPVSFYWDESSVHVFAYQSPLVVTPNAKQYVWANTTGLSTLQGDSMAVSGSGDVTGNYKTQYYLTVSSPYGTTGGQGWYDSGATAYATLNTGIYDYGTGTRRVFTGWGGDASGTNYAQSNPIVMNGPKSAVANWKTQCYLTVRVSPPSAATIPGENWYDIGTNVQLTAPLTLGYTFIEWKVDGASQGLNVTSINVAMNAPHGATAYYQQQMAGSTPVGGISFLLVNTASPTHLTIYFAITAMLGLTLSLLKRKRK